MEQDPRAPREDPLDSSPGRRGSSASGRPLLRHALALAGFGFFVYLVAGSGVTTSTLASVGGLGFGLLLLVSFAVILLDTLAWYVSLRRVGRPGVGRLLALRLGGDAMSNALPGGVLLGEPYKALMVHRWFGISLSDNAASLMTVKFGLGITQSLFVLAGLLLVYPLLRARSLELFGYPGAHYLSLALIVAFQLVLTMLLLATFRGGAFGALLRLLGKLPIAPLRSWLWSNRRRVAALDESCAGVFAGGRGQLALVFMLLLASWSSSSLESYVLLSALGHPVSFAAAFAIESVGSMFRLLFFLVPSGIGGQDASFLALFKLFALPASAGGAFVVIKRGKELVWIGLGFLLLLVTRKASARGAHRVAPVEGAVTSSAATGVQAAR